MFLSVYTYLRKTYPVIPFIPFPYLGCILTYHTNSTEKDLSMPIVRWPIDDISDVPRFFRKKDEPLFFPTVISSGNVFSTVISGGNVFPTVITSGNVFSTVITSRTVWNALRMYLNK